MSEGGFFEQKRSSPTGLVIVIAVHVAAVTALALAKIEVPDVFTPGPITIKNIPLEPDPPPLPPEPVKDRVEPPKSQITSPPRRIETPPLTDFRVPVTETAEIVPFDFTAGKAEKPRVEPLPPAPPPLPIPDPVRTEAKLRPGIELLPPYPASEERAEAEGSVTIKLLIGPDGRVKRAQKVRAASEAFWRATERHALRSWKFTPAMVDGKPVESSKVMTVHFELRG
jgi:protein TonB